MFNRNPIETDESANIALSRMLREMEDTPTRRIITLIDAGCSQEEAERIVSEAFEDAKARRVV